MSRRRFRLGPPSVVELLREVLTYVGLLDATMTDAEQRQIITLARDKVRAALDLLN